MPKEAAKKTKKATKKKTTSTRKRATTRAPKATKTVRKKAAGASLRVRQVRSGIGHAAKYRRTLRALGLKHHQDEVVVVDNPSTRGMLLQVRHLVRVTPAEA